MKTPYFWLPKKLPYFPWGTSSRYFPHNFHLKPTWYTRILRGVFSPGARGWCLRIVVGPGAGNCHYVNILGRRRPIHTGWTLWIGRNVRAGRGDMYRDRPWSVGITRNANHVPYASH